MSVQSGRIKVTSSKDLLGVSYSQSRINYPLIALYSCNKYNGFNRPYEQKLNQLASPQQWGEMGEVSKMSASFMCKNVVAQDCV